MEVTDKKYAEKLKLEMEKEERKAKRYHKRQNGVFSRLISFKNNLKNKQADIVITETKGSYGRAGNRIFIGDKLFRKFKNATKAKKFMGGV